MNNIKNLLTGYFRLKNEIFGLFGMHSNAGYHLEDLTDAYWFSNTNEVMWSPNQEDESWLYVQPVMGHKDCCVRSYEGFSLILFDDQTGGDWTAGIFDNSKRVYRTENF